MHLTKELYESIKAASEALARETDRMERRVVSDSVVYPVDGDLYKMTMAECERNNQKIDLIDGWLKRNKPATM